jgi:hypothetical protein
MDLSSSFHVAAGGNANFRGVDIGKRGLLDLADLDRSKAPWRRSTSGSKSGSTAPECCVQISTKKRLELQVLPVADKARRDATMKELQTLWHLRGHPNVVGFHGAAYSEADGGVVIATDLTDGGTLAELIRLAGALRGC